MQTENTKRLYWIDGIKGISCLFIFFHHFMLARFPASYYGSAKASLLNGFDTLLSTCPFLGIITNGNFFVHIFIALTAYAATWQTLKIENKQIGLFSLKRYLKLLFPISVCALMNFIPHAYITIQTNGNILKEMYKYIRSIFIGVPFCGDFYISGLFWMMNYIFLGGLFASLIATLAWVLDGKKVFIIPIMFAMAICMPPSMQNAHWVSVFLGCALCLFNSFHKVNFGKAIFLLLPAILFFGSFPSGLIPQNVFKHFLLPIKPETTPFYWHSFAAFLLLFLTSNSDAAQKFFSKNFFLKLGTISLWVFILHSHAILISMKLINLLGTDNNLLLFVMSSVLLLAVSVLFAKFLSPIIKTAIEKIIQFFSPKSPEEPVAH